MDFSWMELGSVVIRAFISLISLFFITKLLGKKQVSQLSLFDYVIGISIGNFAAEITINLEANLIYGTVAVLIFGLVAYFISILTMKNITLRRFIIGVPTVLIDKGKILEKGLKKVKFDINDLLEECRNNGVFDVEQINYALMEANGKLSILLKPEYQNVTIKDMNLKQEKNGLVANVIIDKKIMKDSLKALKKDEKWLLKQLKVQGTPLKEVLLGTVDINEKLTLYKENDDVEPKKVLE